MTHYGKAVCGALAVAALLLLAQGRADARAVAAGEERSGGRPASMLQACTARLLKRGGGAALVPQVNATADDDDGSWPFPDFGGCQKFDCPKVTTEEDGGGPESTAAWFAVGA